MQTKHIISIAASILLLASCRQETNNTGISSGRIEYRITYLNKNIDKKTLELLPRKMKMEFNEKMAANVIEGFMGLYKLESVTDFQTRKCSTMLKLFERSYLFKGKRDELMCCFDDMDGMEITRTAETKNIAGFNCKKAVVYLPSSQQSFDIYYTGDINLRHPNVSNPYRKIDGVLMEFELNMVYLKMRFSAEKFLPLSDITRINNPARTFRTISRDQMTELLSSLLD